MPIVRTALFLILIQVLFVPTAQASFFLRWFFSPPEVSALVIQDIAPGSGSDFQESASFHRPSLKKKAREDALFLSAAYNEGDSASRPYTNGDFVGPRLPSQLQEEESFTEPVWALALAPGSPFIETLPEEALLHRETFTVEAGDTFSKILLRMGLSESDRREILKEIGRSYNLARLNSGVRIEAFYDPRMGEGEAGRLYSLAFRPDALTTIHLERRATGHRQASGPVYSIRVSTRELLEKVRIVRGKISSGFWIDAKKAGVPDRIIGNVIKAHSNQLNFNKSLRVGDEFEIMFEARTDANNRIYKTGDLLYSSLVSRGTNYELFRYESNDRAGYYKEDGKSTSNRASITRRPIKGGRLSSGFGMRRHPILKRRKMHNGVDYAAPSGTKIYAAGDGKVIYAGRKGGYGNHVIIDHGNGYKSTYSHMRRIASGIKKGKRVKQWQVIGYVGTTGSSTGNHLHFEILRNGKFINPLKAKLPTGGHLTGRSLENFKSQRARINALWDRARASGWARL